MLLPTLATRRSRWKAASGKSPWFGGHVAAYRIGKEDRGATRVEATDAATLKVGLGNVQVEYLVLGLDGSRHIGDALKGAYLDDLPINRYLLMFVMLHVQQ